MIQEIAVAFIIVIFIAIIIKKTYSILTDDRIYIRATDGRLYRVRNTKNKKETAEALARLNAKINQLVTKMLEEKDEEYKPLALRLKWRYNPETLSEGRIDKRYTSYTVNKGEKLVLCLRTRDKRDALYEDNILFYVTLHELAHIGSVTEDHNDEFRKNFRYLMIKAAEYNLFQKVEDKFEFCGMEVNGM